MLSALSQLAVERMKFDQLYRREFVSPRGGAASASWTPAVRAQHGHIGIVAILTFLLLTGGAHSQERSVVIGAVYNLTGDQHDLDIPSSEGARLAIEEANKAGGVLGRPVRAVFIDGQTRPDIISAQATMLLSREPELAALVGLSDTDMVMAAAPIAARYKRVFLTSGATSPQLPRLVPEYLFLACFADNVQAAAGAEWAYDTLKARTVVVLYKETASYARVLREYFETRFKELGGKVLAVQPYTLDDVRAKVRKLPKADLIYLAAMPEDVAPAIGAVRDAGFDAPILGGDGLDIGDAWHQVSDARKIYFTTHAYLGADNPDPRVRNFRDIYSRAYPNKEPGAFTALGYDAARLLMAAIKSANATEPDAVRNALAGLTDFEAVTGTISYRDGRRIPVKSVSIISVERVGLRNIGKILPRKIPDP
jgi:branched-chain amino acid transport system substrate-binding protein